MVPVGEDAHPRTQQRTRHRAMVIGQHDLLVRLPPEPHLRHFGALPEIDGGGAGLHPRFHDVQELDQIQLLRRVAIILASEEEREPVAVPQRDRPSPECAIGCVSCERERPGQVAEERAVEAFKFPLAPVVDFDIKRVHVVREQAAGHPPHLVTRRLILHLAEPPAVVRAKRGNVLPPGTERVRQDNRGPGPSSEHRTSRGDAVQVEAGDKPGLVRQNPLEECPVEGRFSHQATGGYGSRNAYDLERRRARDAQEREEVQPKRVGDGAGKEGAVA